MIYSSDRSMSDLAAGLIEGCIEYYKENITFSKEDISDGTGTKVRFSLEKY